VRFLHDADAEKTGDDVEVIGFGIVDAERISVHIPSM